MSDTGAGLPVSTVPTGAIRGHVMGGQQPVANGIISLYAFGSTNYGTGAQALATVTAGSDGYFTIDPSQINCPTANTPVYILSIGGDPGFGNNTAILEGSGIGNCGDIANANVTITEISTAALAYTFAHFFSAASTGDVNTNDHFGAPASALQTVINGNSGTLNTILDVANGYPRLSTSTFHFESAKLITLGNILATCVNSVGPQSPGCSSLFQLITSPSGAAPTNTLEAAVYLAENPNQNVSAIYNLQTMSGSFAFTGGLSAAPADWSLSASYTSPSFGLAVNTRTTSTIDIDANGRVWFPSNGSGQAGVGYFDPSSGFFSQLYAAGLTHPQQVAIDTGTNNYVWATDASSPNIAGFPLTSPGSPVTLNLPGTTSTSLMVADDNTLRFGIIAPDGAPALAEVTGRNIYAEINGTEIAGGGGFIASSLAGDYVGGVGVSGQYLPSPTTYDLYYSNQGNVTAIAYQTAEDAGQVAFTGNNYVGTRGGYGTGNDGICIWSLQGCYGMVNTAAVRHPSGLSIDGASSLWLADSFTNTVEQIAANSSSNTNPYLNNNYQANNIIYTHDNNNGGTLPAPAGIAVDGAGNIWVSNYGCNTDGCTPGSFTLSEIIGLGAPTVTPVSQQLNANLVGSMPQTRVARNAR